MVVSETAENNTGKVWFLAKCLISNEHNLIQKKEQIEDSCIEFIFIRMLV